MSQSQDRHNSRAHLLRSSFPTKHYTWESGQTEEAIVVIQQTPFKKLTFEEYLTHADETDGCYEWVNGELIALPPESEPNISTANYLFLVFVRAGVPFRLVHPHMCEVQVPVLQPGDAANRFPDLVILREEHLRLTQRRLTITQEMPPPQLVVEVVSPGRVGRERDYDRKRAQYATLGIPEYWIVDPQLQQVMVLYLASDTLESSHYIESGIFQGTMTIISPTFPELRLTASDIFAEQT